MSSSAARMTTLSRGDTEREILRLARRRPGQTSDTVAAALFLSRAQAQLVLRRLTDAELLLRDLNDQGEYVHDLAPRGAQVLERAAHASDPLR
jgi:predicted ArsR family transcriptional regulator